MANQLHNFFALFIYFLIAFNCINAFKTVKNLQQFISTETIEAEDYSSISGSYYLFHDCPDPNLFYMGSLETDTVIEYRAVNFLDGMKRVIFRAANYADQMSAVDVSLHLGNYTNPPFITIPVNYTGEDACSFVSLHADLSEALTGVQNLSLTFPSAVQGVLHLDWFVFNRTSDTFIATEKIEAEDYSLAYYYQLYDDCADTSITYVGQLYYASTLVYEGVDFGSGVQMVTLRVSNGYEGEPQDVVLHLGNSTNTPLATVPVGQTGTGRCNFLTVNAFLDTKPVGVQDLYFTFPSSPGNYLHLDWFVFNQTVTDQALGQSEPDSKNQIVSNN